MCPLERVNVLRWLQGKERVANSRLWDLRRRHFPMVKHNADCFRKPIGCLLGLSSKSLPIEERVTTRVREFEMTKPLNLIKERQHEVRQCVSPQHLSLCCPCTIETWESYVSIRTRSGTRREWFPQVSENQYSPQPNSLVHHKEAVQIAILWKPKRPGSSIYQWYVYLFLWFVSESNSSYSFVLYIGPIHSYIRSILYNMQND